MPHTVRTSLEPTVRPATLGDAEAIARLSEQLGYPSTTEETDHRLLQVTGQSEHAVYVAEADGRLIGWVHVFVNHSLLADTTAKSPALSWMKNMGATAWGECSWNRRGAGRKSTDAVLCGCAPMCCVPVLTPFMRGWGTE
jgi:hypothetical protein